VILVSQLLVHPHGGNGDDQPYLEIVQSSIVMAKSFCEDWYSGLVGCDMGEFVPGIFYIPGEHTKDEVRIKFAKELKEAERKQNNYFRELVKIADVSWSRTNGNPNSINDDSRMAAMYLGLKEKPWLQDFVSMDKSNCPACGMLMNPNFPVCANCHFVIDKVKAKAIGLEVK
jgi:hypothetical protein